MSAERNAAVGGELKRVLGASQAAWLVAGNMIGAGIFLTPGLVAGRLPGLGWPLAVWLAGGLLALCGAAVYGELGSRLPRAGGDYQFLAAAFGPLWGFLTGWAALVVTFSAAAAAMAIVAVEHLALATTSFGGLPASARLSLAPLLILLLTLANVVGARAAGWTTTLLTALPLTGLLVLFAGGIATGSADLRWPQAVGEPVAPSALALGLALVPVFFTYSGWNAAAYVAGEIREPGRNLARGLLWGTSLVMLFYLSINLMLLLVVPQDELAGSTTAGILAARRLVGPAGERALSWIIAVAVLGSANVTLMAGARIYYAMARDRIVPGFLARTNAAGVPSGALWIGGLWTALLATTAQVERLVNWCTMAMLLLSSLAAASLLVLRWREGDVAPWRCPGYPLTPVIYVLASLGVAGASAFYDWRQALYGLLIVASGLPVYFILRSRDRRYRLDG